MRANKYVSWTQDGDNTIVVNSETQKGLSLDATGKLSWNEIVGGGYSLEQIIRRIAVHYPAEQSKQIESDIRATVAVLHDNSMIT